MANLKFKGSFESGFEKYELESYTTHDEIHISINEPYQNHYAELCLDIPTAIAFRKHLAQQIAKAKEANNG